MLMPAAIVIAIWLAAGQAWRMAVLWCLSFGLGTLLVAATKIAFAGWGMGFHAIDFTGISGHTMLATSIYGTACWLGMQRARPALRAGGMAAGLLAGGLIGVSRLALGVHSPAEVIVGFVLGALICLAFVVLSQRAAQPTAPVLALVAAALALSVATYGKRAPGEDWIAEVARALSGRDLLYIRTTWHQHSGDSLPNETPASPNHKPRPRRTEPAQTNLTSLLSIALHSSFFKTGMAA